MTIDIAMMPCRTTQFDYLNQGATFKWGNLFSWIRLSTIRTFVSFIQLIPPLWSYMFQMKHSSVSLWSGLSIFHLRTGQDCLH